MDYILAKYPDSEVNVLIDSLGGSLATALSIVANPFFGLFRLGLPHFVIPSGVSIDAEIERRVFHCVEHFSYQFFLFHNKLILAVKFTVVDAKKGKRCLKTWDRKEKNYNHHKGLISYIPRPATGFPTKQKPEHFILKTSFQIQAQAFVL